MLYKLLAITISLIISGKALAALPSYSYSEIYMYDSQDCSNDSEQDFSDKIISDPLEPLNRHIFNINSTLDYLIFSPVTEIYLMSVPKRGRMHIGNFLSNLGEPINFISLMLQGKFKGARTSLGRFMTNSTLGFFGIMDVATDCNLKYHGEDSGQTLAHYGVPNGPYIVLPLFGPSSLRDTSGRVADYFANPFKYIIEKRERNIINATSALHKRASANGVIKTINNSLDPYETAKMLYIQNRNKQINSK
jgi:phospholipid-binding lipoprotein MlaA